MTIRVVQPFQNFREGSILSVPRDLSDTVAEFAVKTGLAVSMQEEPVKDEPKAKRAGSK